MKLIVLNGSPKGDPSVTMQYIEYFRKVQPSHEFKIINIAHKIRKIEKELTYFNEIMEDIKSADSVIWAFPLYVLHVHGNYKRFIELISERKVESYFINKPAVAFSTSIHFYDNTAHNYIHGICDDLNMKYLGFYSAAMDDIYNPQMRDQLGIFIKDFISSIRMEIPAAKAYEPLQPNDFNYFPSPINKMDQGAKKVIIISDCPVGQSNLSAMIDTVKSAFVKPVEHIDINNIKMSGGCLGCLHCGIDNICVYDNKDDVRSIYNDKLAKADIVIFAVYMVDRYFSARWKTFVDRRFLNTHQPTLIDKQVIYMISGPLSQEHNLREIIKANTEFDEANLSGIITDEANDSTILDKTIESTLNRTLTMTSQNYRKPKTFLGVGGYKIFRDEIWGSLRFVFQGDYKYYKKHNYFDFPQSKLKTRLTNIVMILMSKVPVVKKDIQKNMVYHMIRGYKDVLNKIS